MNKIVIYTSNSRGCTVEQSFSRPLQASVCKGLLFSKIILAKKYFYDTIKL